MDASDNEENFNEENVDESSEQQKLLDAMDNEENVNEENVDERQQNRKVKRKRRRKLVTAKVLFIFGKVNSKVLYCISLQLNDDEVISLEESPEEPVNKKKKVQVTIKLA